MTRLSTAKEKVNRALAKLGEAAGFHVGYAVVAVLCLPAIWPLVGPTFLASTDGMYHLYRLVDLDFCVRGGVFYPRWLPNLGFGYGYPVLNYYAPLTYYLAELFHLLGAGYVASIKLIFISGFFLSALSMYLYARDIIGARPAVVAGAAYVYLPYHLDDCYVKGAMAEFFAFVFLPVVLWAFHRLIMRRERKYLVFAAVSYAALVLTHNLSALLFSPLLVAYVCLLFSLTRDVKFLGYALLAILIALGLTAFYWFPGFQESSWVLLGKVGATSTDYEHLLVPLSELVSPFFIYRYYPDQGDAVGYPLTFTQLGLAVLSVLVLVRLWRTLEVSTRYHLLFFVGASLLALFMMLSYSSFVWRVVTLLAYLQYPRRFLVLVAMTSSLLIGSALLLFEAPDREWRITSKKTWLGPLQVIAGLAIVLIVMITNLGYLPAEPTYLPGRTEPLTEEGVSLAGSFEFDYLIAAMVRLWGFTWGLEYLPSWVEAPREDFFLPLQSPPTTPQALTPDDIPHVVLGRQAPLSKALQIDTTSEMRLSFHIFYFPGWQFSAKGQELYTFASGPLGLVTTDLEPGEHEVLLSFESTPARSMGSVVSFASLSTLVVLTLLFVQQRKLFLIPLSVLILLIPLLWWHVHSSPSVQHPVPLEANLGDQFKLLGYHIDQSSYRAGDTINVTLYWLALQEMDENYKVFVHLTDEGETRLIAQSDRWPVYNFSPTTRWEAGEIVWDRHEIQIPPDVAPGTYRLATGAYLLETMRNLEVLDDNGNPEGVRIPLTAVDILP